MKQPLIDLEKLVLPMEVEIDVDNEEGVEGSDVPMEEEAKCDIDEHDHALREEAKSGERDPVLVEDSHKRKRDSEEDTETGSVKRQKRIALTFGDKFWIISMMRKCMAGECVCSSSKKECTCGYKELPLMKRSQNASYDMLADMTGRGAETIRSVWRRRATIEDAVKEDASLLYRKRKSGAGRRRKWADAEVAVKDWVLERRKKGFKVDTFQQWSSRDRMSQYFCCRWASEMY